MDFSVLQRKALSSASGALLAFFLTHFSCVWLAHSGFPDKLINQPPPKRLILSLEPLEGLYNT